MNSYIRRLRSLIGNMKIVIPGVRGILLDAEGRVLLQKRGDFLSWGFPAGIVDVGDSALEASGGRCRKKRASPSTVPSSSVSTPIPNTAIKYPNGDEVQTFTIAFLVREWSGTLGVDGVEAVDAGFFALDRLPDPLYPIHVETLEDLRRYDGSLIIK